MPGQGPHAQHNLCFPGRAPIPPQHPQVGACTGDAPTRICRTGEVADLLENNPITETNRSKKIDYL